MSEQAQIFESRSVVHLIMVWSTVASGQWPAAVAATSGSGSGMQWPVTSDSGSDQWQWQWDAVASDQ
jgi:hypothetical protein